MCGIVGIYRFDHLPVEEEKLKSAVSCLKKRGPDADGIYIQGSIGLGHTRLAIIDPDSNSNQPFQDETGRYTLVFNGEIFNYKIKKAELEKEGIKFRTNSDTEVLLQLLIKSGKDCLKDLNGFFAFAFYDTITKRLLVGRDKYGVKPLYIYRSENYIAFASELKSLIQCGIPLELNYSSLLLYLQLNYIPSPFCILHQVQKLKQSHCVTFSGDGSESTFRYYSLLVSESNSSYSVKKARLEHLLEEAVKDRLVSDVPVGVFLSGGVDSSVISLLAKRNKADIQSFSVGFKGNKSFDESIFAEKTAAFLGLQHQTFHLAEEMLLENLDNLLQYSDEPFADSSALAVYNLCYHTKKYVTVALTGDGADEVFGGYNKYVAESAIRKNNILNGLAGYLNPLIEKLPEARGANTGNFFRKIKKYSASVKLTEEERYWLWCSFTPFNRAVKLLSGSSALKLNIKEYNTYKKSLSGNIAGKNLNHLLVSDIHMVLEGDMLAKTDRMSMANSMELRNPFLDSRVVDFSFTLQEKDIISGKTGKKILKETFYNYLPREVFHRPKRGFEVPLTHWLKNDLHYLTEKYLGDAIISNQNIFDVHSVKALKTKLKSSKPDEVATTIWNLINFQIFYLRYFK